jgi:hypothetical protein
VGGKLQWGQRELDPGPPRPLIRQPARLLTGLGCVIVAATGLMTWAIGGSESDGPVTFDGPSGAGDGVTLFLIAALLAFVTFNRSVADSRTPPVRLAPLILAIAAAFEFGLGAQATLIALGEWRDSGGSGHLTVAFWLLGVATLLVVLGATRLALAGRSKTASP